MPDLDRGQAAGVGSSPQENKLNAHTALGKEKRDTRAPPAKM